jgi:hypothetical protein
MVDEKILHENFIDHVSIHSESTFVPRIIVRMLDGVEISSVLRITDRNKDGIGNTAIMLSKEYNERNKSLSRRIKINKILIKK